MKRAELVAEREDMNSIAFDAVKEDGKMDCFSRSGDFDARVEVEEIGVETPELTVTMMGVIKKERKVWEIRDVLNPYSTYVT